MLYSVLLLAFAGPGIVLAAGCPFADGAVLAARAEEAGAPPTDPLASSEVDDSSGYLTSDAGGPIDDQGSLKAGLRGPTLLEDFKFRQKIQHFDHERVCLR